MKILFKSKDGGPNSTVTAFFLIEWKALFSIAFLFFDKGSRDNKHSHAFNARSILLWGTLDELSEDFKDKYQPYKWMRWKKTPRTRMHKVWSFRKSLVFTIRGPWSDTWQEETPDGEIITLTHGREIVPN